MTLRRRLMLGIVGLVLASILVLWGVSSRGILRPFEERVFDAFVTQAVFVAEQIEDGEEPEDLGAQLGLEIHFADGPRLRSRPGSPAAGRSAEEAGDGPGRGRGKARGRWRRALREPPVLDSDDPQTTKAISDLTVMERDGRILVFPPGPRNRILVDTDRGWVLVRRDLEVDLPKRQLRWALVALALSIVLVAFFLSSAAIRPLTTARQGMERIASGDLSHRIAEGGPDELARVARAFNAMADRIDSLLRTERELMAGLSHELRTPLARLRLEMELLRDAGASEKRVAAMEGDLIELDGLIEQLMGLSALQLGRRELSKEPVALRDLADEAIAIAKLSEHEVVVSGRGGTVDADRALVLRVLVNLLQNAGRYAPKGTSIFVTLDAPRLVVEDEGPGVPRADLPRLFDPFWRGEASRAKATGGLGLGLMLVHQVVSLHGGTVSAENRSPTGLRVEVDLGGAPRPDAGAPR